MKRLLLLFAMVLAITGIATAAEQAVYTCTFSKNDATKNTSYTSSWTETCNGKKYTVTNFNNNNWGWAVSGSTTDCMIKCGRKDNASVAFIATEFSAPETINKIEVTINSITASKVNSIYLQTSTDANFTNPVKISTTSTLATGKFVINIPAPAENLYYKVVFDCAAGSSNGLIQISKLVYYADVTTGPKDFSFDGFKDYTLEVDETAEFALPDDAPTINFTSSNDAIAEADKHGVYAYAAGTAEITAAWEGSDAWNAGETKFNVTVTKPLAKAEIVFEHDEFNKLVGDEPFAITYMYEGATNPEITFSSSNENVATVAKGEGESIIVSIIGAGTATITATAAATADFTAATATTTINVTDPNGPLEATFDFGKSDLANLASKTIAASKETTNNDANILDGVTLKSSNISLSLSKGTGSNVPRWWLTTKDDKTELRVYSNNTMTISASSGYYITNVTFTDGASGDQFGMSANTGNINNKVWTPTTNTKPQSVDFKITTNSRIGSITVTYAETGEPMAEPIIMIDGENVDLDSSIELNGKTATVSFDAPAGVAVWTRFTPASGTEQQMAKAEAQFEEYKAPIELNEDGTFEYYTVANGKQSGIKSFAVTGGTTAISEIEAAEGEAEYFDLMGRRVANPANGLYIRRQAGKVEKVYVK